MELFLLAIFASVFHLSLDILNTGFDLGSLLHFQLFAATAVTSTAICYERVMDLNAIIVENSYNYDGSLLETKAAA